MRSKKGKKGWMAIKIDLEKAYERLNWEFVRNTLQDIGLPVIFIDLVWHSISSPRMRVVWNGEALEEFSPSRGTRQGDPISPYLFVLCIERLSQLIQCATDQGLWKPICLARWGPKSSHLMFADDFVLFAEATMEQVHVIKMCLNLCCTSLGQKVSNDKTWVFFSKNVHWRVWNELSDAMGFQRMDDLGKYLGVPILHKRVTKHTFGYILDKASQCLSTWKARSLSMAGRGTLVRSVL